MADVNVSASQTVTVSELVEMFLLSISTSDSVSVLEVVTAVQVDILKQHEAMIMPVWELSGSFAQALLLSLQLLKFQEDQFWVLLVPH